MMYSLSNIHLIYMMQHLKTRLHNYCDYSSHIMLHYRDHTVTVTDLIIPYQTLIYLTLN